MVAPVQIVIPVGPYHLGLAGAAIRSAEAQTVPCEVVVIEDQQGRGAGWARNQGWRQANCSPFTVFLDADDVLAPDFVARTLATYRPPHYVYTDWQTGDGEVVRTPDRTDLPGWYEGRVFHTVSVLMPTALLAKIGGFDERLTAMEETDLFLRLRRFGVCGLRCPDVLMIYRTRHGQRAKMARETGDGARIHEWLRQTYGETMGCGCGGGAGSKAAAPMNEKQTGDVMALSLLPYNRSVRGQATARRYFASPGAKMWVNAQDVKLDPEHWQIVFDPVDIVPSVDDVLAMAGNVVPK